MQVPLHILPFNMLKCEMWILLVRPTLEKKVRYETKEKLKLVGEIIGAIIVIAAILLMFGAPIYWGMRSFFGG